MLKKFSLIVLLISVLTLLNSLSVAASTVHSSSDNESSKLQATLKAHYQFSQHFYSLVNTKKYDDVEKLHTALKHAIANQESVIASSIIANNQALIIANPDTELAITSLIQLLDNEQMLLANRLFKAINKTRDRAIKSQAAYYFAQYYLKYQMWPQLNQTLSGKSYDLEANQYNHRLLMEASALQRQNRHRESISVLEKIAKDSPYFQAAQINLASAYLSQEWWTQGHKLLQQLIATAEQNNDEIALNRLAVMLGYSQLKQHFYRDARQAFNLVAKDSRYASQSLIGVSLAAAHQEDFVVALNAIRIIKSKQGLDLPSQETYFLMPYYYERAGQIATADDGYNNAITYYISQQSRLQGLLALPKEQIVNELIDNQYPEFFIQHGLDLGINVIPFIANNLKQLRAITPQIQKLPPAFTRQQTKLIEQYESLLHKQWKDRVKTQIDSINSYMDQSRFGLIRLYDSNKEQQ